MTASMTRDSSGTYRSFEEPWTGPPVAVLWDQSLLWGLICLQTLKQCSVPFDLVSAGEIAGGCLDGYRVLLVPGGWASHKARALGETGAHRLSQFVQCGGSYLGFCGGAGLALSSPSSLGLVPQQRMSLSQRLPNASGQVWIEGVPGHPLWDGLPLTLPVSVWWPAQFMPELESDCACLATYRAAGEDFWVADLPLSDLPGFSVPWKEWEKIYGINLAPTRLLGHPAMIEVKVGKGRLILSYPHLDTPDDGWANRLFIRCLRYLDAAAGLNFPDLDPALRQRGPESARPGRAALKHIKEAAEAVEALIAFGQRHLLWTWRLPWLLNWRRGIRGLEYGTLAVVMAHLVQIVSALCREGEASDDAWAEPAQKIGEGVVSFCSLARALLLEEKLATRTTHITKLGKVNAAVDYLRGRLFGNKMNHGGMCRELFDDLDRFLLTMLRMEQDHCAPVS